MKWALMVVPAGLGMALLCSVLVDAVPPREMTATTMWVIKRRILRYAQAHGQLPTDLSQLEPLEHFVNDTADAWGRPIGYEVRGDQTVVLTSLGKDGAAGGTGDDADIVKTFRARDARGRWSDELVEWSPESPVMRRLMP